MRLAAAGRADDGDELARADLEDTSRSAVDTHLEVTAELARDGVEPEADRLPDEVRKRVLRVLRRGQQDRLRHGLRLGRRLQGGSYLGYSNRFRKDCAYVGSVTGASWPARPLYRGPARDLPAAQPCA